MPHYKLHITGRVQGVGFRAATQAQAQQIGVNGFVRNEPDGSVYLEATGTTTQLQQLVAWVRKGPPLSQVHEVKVEKSSAEPDFAGFAIRRQ